MLRKIYLLLNLNERKNAILLLFITIFAAFLDVVGVAAIMPILTLLTNKEVLFNNKLVNNFYQDYSFTSQDNFVVFLCIIFIMLLLFTLAVKSLSVYFQIRFSVMREYSLTGRLIKSYLSRSYDRFLSSNSSDIGTAVLAEVAAVVENVIFPYINLIANATLVIVLSLFLIFYDPLIAFSSIGLLGGIYFIIYLLSNKKLKAAGKHRKLSNEKRYNSVFEVFGAIKEVKFARLESSFLGQYNKHSYNYALQQIIGRLWGQLPRYFIETLTFVLLISLVITLSLSGAKFENLVPTLGLYAFSAYRLLPSLQNIYSSVVQLNFSVTSLNSLYHDLVVDNNSEDKLILSEIAFTRSIDFKEIQFKYPNTSNSVLQKLTININSGDIVGFVGGSGSGKTTIIDILLGLLTPTAGNVFIDDKLLDSTNLISWREIIGYVPQQIFLSDDTIEANIAFGYSEIDHDLVVSAAKLANLHEFVINNLESGYKTKVGERGIRLSGGQRQRIGIARALYRQPRLIIFDEATSALDNITEREVMNSIYNLKNNITVIIVAHRLSTIINCDKVFFLENGNLIGEGSYSSLVSRNDKFKKLVGINDLNRPNLNP